MTQPWPVLLVARELDHGGSERQLTEVAKALDRARFTPHVGAFRAGGSRWRELEAADVPVVHLPVPSVFSVRGFFAIRRYLRNHRILLTHAFDQPSNIYAATAARIAGCPVVLSSQRAHRSLFSQTQLRALRVADRFAHGIVVNCDFIRRSLIEEDGIPASRLHLCHNGVDLRIFHPAPARRPESLRNAAAVIGVICVLRPEKGLDTLMAAFGRLRQRASGVKLLIVGSGPVLPALQDQARRLGVFEDCHFEPAVSDVTPWLRAIDIFVLPSRSEALSNSLMEAMAAGCCAVASRVGGNPELVTDGVTGLLFPPGDDAALGEALLRLVGNPAERAAFAAGGARSMAEDFSIEHSARRMGEIYEAFLLRARSPREPSSSR